MHKLPTVRHLELDIPAHANSKEARNVGTSDHKTTTKHQNSFVFAIVRIMLTNN